MSAPRRNSKPHLQKPLGDADAAYISGVLNHYGTLDPDYFSYEPSPLSEDAFQSLSKSDYAKVIFCDLYYNTDSTVGCRFQITDNVHEDPCDYIGLFRVGYDNLSQCLASKMLSDTECEEDGKLIRCTFKPSELPELENGYYQFLYVTRDNEVCGASMPFQTKNTITKGLNCDEDIVADNTEDDFLIVKSNMAEKNRRLQGLLDEMTEKSLKYESDMRKIHEKLKILTEEKHKIEQLLKQACVEKIDLYNEARKIKEEKNVICQEKEEAIRILREKNKVFSTMFEDYSEKLKEFTELKDELLDDKRKLLEEKNLAVAENVKLQEQIKKITEDLQKRQNVIDLEMNKSEELTSSWKKESSLLLLKLEDAQQIIKDLQMDKQLNTDELLSLNKKVETLQDQLKEARCHNLVLKTRLSESTIVQLKTKNEMHDMISEIAALKLHVIELHESNEKSKSEVHGEELPNSESQSAELTPGSDMKDIIEKIMEEVDISKSGLVRLRDQLNESLITQKKLQEEIVKLNGVVEYLTKERDTIQKNSAFLQDALNESILRLTEGSKLYKKQFRKIEKLKEKMKRTRADFMVKASSSATVGDSCSCSSVVDSADETASAVQLSQNQNSDSDTGEHVLRDPLNDENEESSKICEVAVLSYVQALHVGNAAVENEPTCSKNREVPELQTLIEMNLEKFKNSQAKEEEGDVQYSIPCPVCDQDIGVFLSSSEEMVKHLEVQHKQQLCPICGRLFDMTLPSKYFLFHVEDHFKTDSKK